MKLIFLKPGEYKSGTSVIKVIQSDVDKEKVFDVVDKNAVNFIKVEKAKQAQIKKSEKNFEKEPEKNQDKKGKKEI